MKKTFVLFSVIYLLLSGAGLAQESSKYGWLSKEAWAFGFGFSYPKYISTNTDVREESGYGGFLSIQRNYSEHIGVRLEAKYLHLAGYLAAKEVTNDVIVGNLDLLYYLIPCEPISPYLGIGLGAFYNTIENSPDATLNEGKLDYQMNLRFGAEYRIGEDWKLKTELAYHTTAASNFDGDKAYSVGGGILGGHTDSYMTFDLGAVYYFGYGEKSNLCQMYEKLDMVDYDKIESIVKRYQVEPVEVDYNRIEDIIKKHKTVGSTGTTTVESNWVLIGVNFDFNSDKIRPESLPILYNAASILLTNPEVKVEIQGHTDNVGSDRYNQVLSEKRANSVRNFLIAKGVEASRLTAVGVGETKPIMDNKTEQGRGLNRRIEFKVK